MNLKQEIVKRLLENKQITFEEALVLLEVKEYVNLPYNPLSPCNPYNPPFLVTCNSTTGMPLINPTT
jgi:hypothetical protein